MHGTSRAKAFEDSKALMEWLDDPGLRNALLEFLSQGIVVTDADSRILAVNPAFTEITGYSEDEVLGRNPKLLSSGRQGADFYAEMWETIHRQGWWSGEIWNRHKDGSTFPEHQTIVAVPGSDGETAYYLAVFSDLSRVKAYQQQVEHLAHYDPLTGLPNRLLFRDRLGQCIVTARRCRTRLAVVLMDVTDFKAINDSLGHTLGDQVLAAVGQRLVSDLPEDVTVARLSGDEFAILIPRLEQVRDAVEVAEHVLHVLDRPLRVGGRDLLVSGCLGLSVFPEDGDTPDSLMQRADTAMYQAKNEGVGYRFFQAELTAEARDRVELAGALRDALDGNHLAVYYQEKVDLGTGERIGLEALIRWPQADGRFIPPARFIPVAERTGLIGRVGDWVIEDVCRQVAEWRAAGLETGRVAVNVAAPQLAEPSLVGRVLERLRAHDLPPEALEFEVTESMLVGEGQDCLPQLRALREQGITVAIDDFGTGYSSLSYLRDLPVDRIKIDRSFVHGLPDNRELRAITRAIAALGNSLGYRVLAEGVETEAQRRFLVDHGCSEGQGFLFGWPQPGSAVQPVGSGRGAKR